MRKTRPASKPPTNYQRLGNNKHMTFTTTWITIQSEHQGLRLIPPKASYTHKQTPQRPSENLLALPPLRTDLDLVLEETLPSFLASPTLPLCTLSPAGAGAGTGLLAGTPALALDRLSPALDRLSPPFPFPPSSCSSPLCLTLLRSEILTAPLLLNPSKFPAP